MFACGCAHLQDLRDGQARTLNPFLMLDKLQMTRQSVRLVFVWVKVSMLAGAGVHIGRAHGAEA